MFLLGEDNGLRKFCRLIVSHKLFDNVILALIGFSTVLLAIDNPLQIDPNGAEKRTLS